MAWYDYVPVASNVAGIVKGDPAQAIGGATYKILDAGYDWAKPKPTDTTGLKDAQDRAFGTQDFYRNQLVNYGGEYDPARAKTLAGQGDTAIGLQLDAARGAAPSAAEMMLRDQAARNAAGSFGIAAALQGRSPGMALRQATIGSVQTQAQAARDAGVLRAQEMERARQGLVQAVQGQQNVLNQTRGADIEQKGQFNGADIGALRAAGDAAAGVANVDAKNKAADTAFKSGLVNLGTGTALKFAGV